MGVGFGVPFFVSGLYKFMGKLADGNFFRCPGPTGVGFGVPFFVSGLYKFMGKLADIIFFGVQGPRGLGLGCRSLCLAFISLWENSQIEYFSVSTAHGGWVCSLFLAFMSLWEN